MEKKYYCETCGKEISQDQVVSDNFGEFDFMQEQQEKIKELEKDIEIRNENVWHMQRHNMSFIKSLQEKIDKLEKEFNRFPKGINTFHKELWDVTHKLEEFALNVYEGLEYQAGGHFGDRILSLKHTVGRAIQKIDKLEKENDELAWAYRQIIVENVKLVEMLKGRDARVEELKDALIEIKDFHVSDKDIDCCSCIFSGKCASTTEYDQCMQNIASKALGEE